MRFGLWNVRSFYRAGLTNDSFERNSKCKLDLVGVQEVRWEGDGTEPAGESSVPTIHMVKQHFKLGPNLHPI
jgi:hypothetical protein